MCFALKDVILLKYKTKNVGKMMKYERRFLMNLEVDIDFNAKVTKL